MCKSYQQPRAGAARDEHECPSTDREVLTCASQTGTVDSDFGWSHDGNVSLLGFARHIRGQPVVRLGFHRRL